MNNQSRILRRAVFSLSLLLGVSPLSFSTPDCDEDRYQQAEMALSRVEGWDSVYQFYKQYPNCEDRYLGEGSSTVVSSLFAEHWDHVSDVLQNMHRDKGFKAFVIGHLDARVITETLQRIDSNLRSVCPTEYRSECAAIQEQVSEGLKYLVENNPSAEPSKPLDPAPLDPFGHKKDHS